MNGCNATLTTATVHDRCQFGAKLDCHHHRCIKMHGEWRHVELHTLTCHYAGWPDGDHRSTYLPAAGKVAIHGWTSTDGATFASWSDDMDGATPHTPVPTVTDAEFKAAANAFHDHIEVHAGAYNSALDAALEAAAAVRAAQETTDE